jgi:twinkle protein
MNFKDNNIQINPLGPDQQKVLCPECKRIGKEHWEDKCLSVNITKGIWNCHKCNWTGGLKPSRITNTGKMQDNIIKNKGQKLEEKITSWFINKRGISIGTLAKMKITQCLEYMPQTGKEELCIQFPFFREGKLVNTKYRDCKKNFKLDKNAELIFYNLDSIKASNEVVIVEGEIDALSFIEAGIDYVVSVPNGANGKSNNLTYIDSSADYFKNKEKIFIATDNDIPGIRLRDELVRRFGVEKCYKVDLGFCKDANEFMVKYSKNELIEALKRAKPFPIEGIFSIDRFWDELNNLYEKGLEPGKKIGIENIDNLISYDKGRLYVITGIPGHGKSEWIDFVMERLAILFGYRFGIFSPENHPLEIHASKLIEKISGKRFSKDTLNKEEFDRSRIFANSHFFFVRPKDESFSLDMILEKARALIFRNGIHGLVIDPWNRLDHDIPKGLTETNYISYQLSKLTNFAQVNGIMIFLIAHPTKIPKEKESGLYEVPNLYSISGSANFFNKTDFGLTIYRDFINSKVSVYVQKVKFRHLGSVGVAEFKYNINNGRFTPLITDSTPPGKEICEFDNSSHLDINKNLMFEGF